MGVTVLNEQEYHDKVYGGWLGKNIGGTLGTPVEGVKEQLDLTFFPVLPSEPLANDDLDLQLVWLHALEQYGVRITARELGQEWLEHVFFPMDEYGYALANLRRGLVPPVCGWFNNPFKDCMGAPIRSEIWAMIAPASPAVAARYAYEDAIVDHAGGEGVHGEVFFAALESAAFVEGDKHALVGLALSHIPAGCRTALAVRDLVSWHDAGLGWEEARRRTLARHGRENFTDAPQNVAFTILGLLYGKDFGDSILKAVNCGYDADCTAATLGAILGILGGRHSLPERWTAPLGDRVVVSSPIVGFDAPEDLEALTRRTMRIAREVCAAWDLPIRFSAAEPTSTAPSFARHAVDRGLPATAGLHLLPAGSRAALGLEAIIDYGERGPAIGIGEAKTIRICLRNDSPARWEGTAELALPEGWSGPAGEGFSLGRGESMEWVAIVVCGGVLEPAYALELRIRRLEGGSEWQRLAVPFALVAATHWRIHGPSGEASRAAVFPGNRLALNEALGTDEPGVYRASTTLVSPVSRRVKLIVGTGCPIRVRVDGAVVLEDASGSEWMPAFHRAPDGKFVEVWLAAGRHRLDVEFTQLDAPLDVYVLAVAADAADGPGSNYYLTDMCFAPPEPGAVQG